jgi:integrase
MFEQRWPLGTRANLAMRLLLYTGQCRGDVIKMGRQHVRNGVIEVLQAKTGARLAIPVHRQLQEALATLPTFDMTFLMTDFGRPFASGAAFYQWFIWCCRQAGLAAGLSPHGLRKASARRLAEAGCTPHEIASITGHKTLAEVERYTRAVNQAELAKVAMRRIGPRSTET